MSESKVFDPKLFRQPDQFRQAAESHQRVLAQIATQAVQHNQASHAREQALRSSWRDQTNASAGEHRAYHEELVAKQKQALRRS